MKGNIYFADFETLTKDSKDYQKLQHTDVYMWCLLKDKTNYKIGYSLDSFFDYITTQIENYNIIFFHNLKWDGNFIIKYLFRKKVKFNNQTKISRDRNEFSVFSNGKNIYKIEYNYKCKTRRVRIIFQCSLKILSAPVKMLGKQYGFTKMEGADELIEEGLISSYEEFYNLGSFNMTFKIKKLYEKYIYQDCLIVYLAFNDFVNNIKKSGLLYSKKFKKEAFNLYKKLTAGSISYELSKNWIYNHYPKQIKKYSIPSKDWDFGKNWFSGGFTQFNPKYHNKILKKLDNGYVFDINSSYPFSMTQLLPMGKLYEKRNPAWKKHLEFYEIEVKDCLIKNKYWDFVILKNWKKENVTIKDRYVRELSNFKCFYTKIEWEFIQTIYDFNVKNIKIWYCEAGFLIKGFVEKLYEFKQNSKSAGEKQTWKILLNSGFGKQATRKEYEKIFLKTPEQMEKYNLKDIYIDYDSNGKEIRRYVSRKGVEKYFGQNWYELGTMLEENNKQNCSNILIASYITSYSRMLLFNAIKKIGIENWLYCDTDSIFIKNISIEKLKTLINIDSDELGAWKLESEIIGGKILGAKRYGFLTDNGYIKLAFSGVNEIGEIENLEHINSILTDGNIIDGAQTRTIEDSYGYYLEKIELQVKKGSL